MSDWPSPADALEQLRDREFQDACKRHRKQYGAQETSEALDRAKERAAGMDALKWKRRA